MGHLILSAIWSYYLKTKSMIKAKTSDMMFVGLWEECRLSNQLRSRGCHSPLRSMVTPKIWAVITIKTITDEENSLMNTEQHQQLTEYPWWRRPAREVVHVWSPGPWQQLLWNWLSPVLSWTLSVCIRTVCFLNFLNVYYSFINSNNSEIFIKQEPLT